MNDIMSLLIEKKLFLQKNPVLSKEIEKAEKLLNIHFNEEYKKYLRAFGEVSYYGHELTGICEDVNLNVVNVTLNEREFTVKEAKTWYVIEQTHFDGIVIWQDQNGFIYKTKPIEKVIKIYDTLYDYINNEK